MTGSVARDRRDEPRWVTEGGQRTPHGVYARTYEAIAASDDGGPVRRSSVVRAVAWLLPLAALALAVFAFRHSFVARPGASLLDTVRSWSPPVSRDTGPPVIGAAPVGPKAHVRVGDALDFAVLAGGHDLRFGWTVDGAPAGTGPRWTYTPALDAVGEHRVEVSVADGTGRSVQAWTVRVRPGRNPRIVTARPALDTLEVTRGDPTRLAVAPEPGTPDESLNTTWTVDGTPAGDGTSLMLHPPHAGVVAVRAVVTGALGGTASRDWTLHVVEPPPPPVVAEREEPPDAPEATPVAPARPGAQTTRLPSAPVARTPSAQTPADDDVRRWLGRYAAAWRAHDVETLRRMGQVTTDDQVAALERYFEHVSDLDVELDVIALEARGDRTIVRFVRRDRFRDPAGRLVETESPPIEKQVVRTSDGFRFAPARPPA